MLTDRNGNHLSVEVVENGVIVTTHPVNASQGVMGTQSVFTKRDEFITFMDDWFTDIVNPSVVDLP